MATLKLEIVTPEAKSYSEEVDMVTLPAIGGEMGILPMHSPIVTQIVPGLITIRKGMEETHLVVGGGFAQITANKVSVLTELAIGEEDTSEAKVEEALKRAQGMRDEKLSAQEIAFTDAAIKHSLSQLKLRRRGTPRTSPGQG